MISLTDWIGVIPPEDKLIAYVGEHETVTRQFFLPDLSYQDYAFYLDLAFDLSTVTSTTQPREVESTQQTTSEIVNADGTSVTATAKTSKESYTQSEVTVDCAAETDIAPLTKLVRKDGILLTWTVLAQQTQLPGLLRATVRAVAPNDAVKKSSMLVFYVAPSVAASPALPIELSEYEQMEKAMELALSQAAQETLDSFTEQLDEAVGGVTGFKSYVDDQFASVTDDVRELELEFGHLNEYVNDTYVGLRSPANMMDLGMVFAAQEAWAAELTGVYFSAGEEPIPLQTLAATEDMIDARENAHCPIVPANLEYAVKSVGDSTYASREKFNDEVGELKSSTDSLWQTVDQLDSRTASSVDLGMVFAALDSEGGEGTGIVYGGIEGGVPVALHTVKATEEQIDARENAHCPIVPANLEYAVKSVGDGYYAKAEDVGDIETALDSIIAMQESLIGGDAV